VVFLDRHLGEDAIARDQSLDGVGDLFFHQTAHGEDVLAQLAQLVFVLSIGVGWASLAQPKRPVM